MTPSRLAGQQALAVSHRLERREACLRGLGVGRLLLDARASPLATGDWPNRYLPKKTARSSLAWDGESRGSPSTSTASSAILVCSGGSAGG